MLIVDCYNLLHTAMPEPLAGLDEAGLVRLIAAGRYGGATIVCDGTPKPHAPQSLSVEGVELVYAGPGRSADDVIIAMIDQASAPRRVSVVTNDHAIRRAAARRRARPVTCQAFIGQLSRLAMRRASSPPPAADKTHRLPTSTDYWLEEFGLGAGDPKPGVGKKSEVSGKRKNA